MPNRLIRILKSKQTPYFFLSGALSFLFAFFVFSGCTIKKTDIPVLQKGVNSNLPENIFKTTPGRYDPKVKVMVFEFESPDYAARIGHSAAETLSQNFLTNRIFSDVFYEPGKWDLMPGQKIQFARQKGCVWAVFGKVNYYFEGSDVQEARIDEEMKVYDTVTSELIWHAETVAISRPVTENDMTILTIKGEKAYSGTALLNINALKFCNLFSAKP